MPKPALENAFRPINNALKKRGAAEAAMVIKIYKNAENNDGGINKPLKHIRHFLKLKKNTTFILI